VLGIAHLEPGSRAVHKEAVLCVLSTAVQAGEKEGQLAEVWCVRGDSVQLAANIFVTYSL
jgi:hypothetical protein